MYDVIGTSSISPFHQKMDFSPWNAYKSGWAHYATRTQYHCDREDLYNTTHPSLCCWRNSEWFDSSITNKFNGFVEKSNNINETFLGVMLSTMSPSSVNFDLHSTGINSTRSVKLVGLARRQTHRKSAVFRTTFRLCKIFRSTLITWDNPYILFVSNV